MKNRFLGNSKLYVSPIGLGTWQFSKKVGLAGKFWDLIPEETIDEIVLESLNNEVNWFDTAELYGRGESERALARALMMSKKPSCEIRIATKWNPTLKFASTIKKNIDERLKNLMGYPIDLYQVHNPFSLSSVKEEMKQMALLVKNGKIKNIGVSNYSAKQMLKADKELKKKGLFLTSNQVKYNLLDRKIERNGILQAAKDNNIAIIAYSPLEQGILTGRFHNSQENIKNLSGFRKYTPAFKENKLKKTYPLIKLLMEIGDKYQATPAQVALNWLINFHGDMVFAIPGASKVAQAKDNAKAINLSLTKDEMDEIDRLSWSVNP